MPMNFFHSPVWGITGRLSSWQKRDAKNAKDARLEREGVVDRGPEKHVREGHADRKDLLEWGTKVTAEGRKERREVVDTIKRCPSPLKRRTSKDFEEVYKVENEIARRRMGDSESEMIFEKAMEKARLKRERAAERKRREQERYEEMWTPKDVTLRESGIGAAEDNERRRRGSEEGRPGDEVRREGETTDRDVTPGPMSRPEMETANKEVEDLKEEVENMARRASMEADISSIKRSQSILDVREQEARNAAAERRKVEEHTIRTINKMQDIEDAGNRANTTESTHPHIVGARLKRGESARFVDGVVEAAVPDHQAHVDMLQAAQALLDEDTEPPPPLKIKREIPPRSPTRPQPSPIPAEGGVGAAERSVEEVSPKSADVETFKENAPADVKISEQEVRKSIAPKVREGKWVQGDEGETARAMDDISPKSQPKSAQGDEIREKMDEIKHEMDGKLNAVNVKGQILNGAEAMVAESLVSMTEQHNPKGIPIPVPHSPSRQGQDSNGQASGRVSAPGEEMREKMDERKHDMEPQAAKKPVGIPIPRSSKGKVKEEEEHDDLGQVKGPVRDKWVKGTEGESARDEGGVSPKSVRIGSAVMSVADAGYGKDEEGGGLVTREEADKEVAEQDAAQRRTEKWVKGTEGEEARMEGNVSPKSVRVGSAVMSLDGGYISSQEGKGSMRSARSHVGAEHGEVMDEGSMKSARRHVGEEHERERDGGKRGKSVEEEIANGSGGLAEDEIDEGTMGGSAEEQLANGPGGMAG